MTKVVNSKEVDSEQEYTYERAAELNRRFYQKSREIDAKLNALLEECGLEPAETFHDYAERRGFLKDLL